MRARRLVLPGADSDHTIVVWAALLALTGCGGAGGPAGETSDGAATDTTGADTTGAEADAPAEDGRDVVPTEASETEATTGDAEDTPEVDAGGEEDAGDALAEHDAETDDDATEVDDAPEVDDGPVNPCLGTPAGTACALAGYVPPCYAGRCNERETCVLAPIERCCRVDADCPPEDAATACEEPRCVASRCALTRVPGCCADGAACALGACEATSGRCAACPTAACPDAAPILHVRFDAGAWPMSVTDYQAADQVGWAIDPRRWAAGGAAAYLGNTRCRTYYGGALDAACAPATDGEQDSGRVQVVTRTSFFALPAGEPVVASLWIWAEVEPSGGRGLDEPDLLRVFAEPGDGTPRWLVATTLDVGKSTGGAWRPLLLDLAPWAGSSIRLVFEFDTFDGEDNRHEGVWLDELVVARACADGGCCASDFDCAEEACRVGRCVAATSGTGGRCVMGPREPDTPCVACDSDGACDDLDPCTADRCALGRCEHDAFCCLERDVLVHEVAASGMTGLAVVDDDALDGVTWMPFGGALAFVDPLSGTYASRPPGRPVSGRVTTGTFVVPLAGAGVGLDVTLTLSTEWDLWAGAVFTNPAGLDRLTISVVDGALVSPVWSSDQIEGTTGAEPATVRVDLAPWRGRTVQVRLAFASGDADQNDFAGPRVTRIAAGVRCEGW